ncbi:6,7-dimethyl-8-ribityllumazine synthase [bacterium]|jgi:6,7-dimethyl-8-ribityllumazine synthase|nr:6,7-dimethyl-8-ribityllumazine synthase [bacterium]
MKGITEFTPSTLSINSNYGIVYTSWNQEIVSSLLENTTKELLSLGVNKNNISFMEVPGAFEVPLASKSLASKVDAVIALGAIVKGDTPHFDFIASSCAQGIVQASLEENKPIIFGVLTTNNVEQALERSDANRENKGAEFARSAMQMIEALSS